MPSKVLRQNIDRIAQHRAGWRDIVHDAGRVRPLATEEGAREGWQTG